MRSTYMYVLLRRYLSYPKILGHFRLSLSVINDVRALKVEQVMAHASPAPKYRLRFLTRVNVLKTPSRIISESVHVHKDSLSVSRS